MEINNNKNKERVNIHKLGTSVSSFFTYFAASLDLILVLVTIRSLLLGFPSSNKKDGLFPILCDITCLVINKLLSVSLSFNQSITNIENNKKRKKEKQKR